MPSLGAEDGGKRYQGDLGLKLPSWSQLGHLQVLLLALLAAAAAAAALSGGSMCILTLLGW